MRKLMHRFSIAFALAVAGVFLLSLPPSAWAQRARPRERIIIVEPFRPVLSDLQRASELRTKPRSSRFGQEHGFSVWRGRKWIGP